jgi:two-component system, LytTR family, response regulator
MSKIKTLIVEDEQQNIDLLGHFIKSYCPQLEVVATAMSLDDAIVEINNTNPDLIFLDIMLGESNGFELLDILSEKLLNVIFVTAYNQFAVKAFQYSALDYLLKPLDIDALIIAVERATQNIEMKQVAKSYAILKENLKSENSIDSQITVQMQDSVEILKFNSIVHISADGKYSTFTLSDGSKVVSSKNIGEYEKLLPENLFYRVHHTYLIGIKHLSKIDKKLATHCVMNNGDEIPISRRKKIGFLKALE